MTGHEVIVVDGATPHRAGLSGHALRMTCTRPSNYSTFRTVGIDVEATVCSDAERITDVIGRWDSRYVGKIVGVADGAGLSTLGE